jgi:hypothetical protein
MIFGWAAESCRQRETDNRGQTKRIFLLPDNCKLRYFALIDSRKYLSWDGRKEIPIDPD